MDKLEKAAPSFEIELGGRTWKVKCNLLTYANIQKATGLNPWSVDFYKNWGPREAIGVIWAAIVKNEKPTFDEVAEMFDSIDQAAKLAMKICEALQRFGGGEPSEKNADPGQK